MSLMSHFFSLSSRCVVMVPVDGGRASHAHCRSQDAGVAMDADEEMRAE